MLAVDTNVLVRFLTRDHSSQSPRAAEVMHSGDIWISKTVLIEAAWVLQKHFRLTAADVAKTFAQLLGVPTVYVEDRLHITHAVHAAANGLDFADALHVYSSEHAGEFVTFDQRLAKRAQRMGLRVRAL